MIAMEKDTTKTFDDVRKAQNKLPLEALVILGDALHNCRASFVLVLDDELISEDNRSVTFAQHGDRTEIIQMFEKVFETNPEFIEMILEAVVRTKLNQIINN